MDKKGFLEQSRCHYYIKNRKEVMIMEGESTELFGASQMVKGFCSDPYEKVECCCREECYGLVLGKYEHDPRCCK
jgi:hypothetical protein